MPFRRVGRWTAILPRFSERDGPRPGTPARGAGAGRTGGQLDSFWSRQVATADGETAHVLSLKPSAANNRPVRALKRIKEIMAWKPGSDPKRAGERQMGAGAGPRVADIGASASPGDNGRYDEPAPIAPCRTGGDTHALFRGDDVANQTRRTQVRRLEVGSRQ